jgi:hypothetical protein
MLQRSSAFASRRRGIVLLVVLAMMTLFASVAVAFVYFSEGATVEMTLRKEGEQVSRPDPDLLFAFALNQIVHDGGSANSALRTHSLLTNMYGSSGHTPYTGLGRRRDRTISSGPLFDDGLGAPTVLWPAVPPIPPHFANPYYLINYAGRPYSPLAHGEFNPNYTYPDHDNAFLGSVTADMIVTARSYVRTVTPPLEARLPPDPPYSYPFGFNPYDPYCLRVGANPPVPPPGAAEPTWYRDFWTNPNSTPDGFTTMPVAVKKAMVMRPGPWDSAVGPVFNSSGVLSGYNSLFPMPEDAGGDVKNLPPGFRTLVGWNPTTGQPIFANNDSIWLDLDFPIQVDQATGRKYKPLFAFFILALDGRINLNVAGNVRGSAVVPPAGVPNAQQASAHGLGPWEVNPTFLAGTQDALPLREWLNLYGGNLPTISGAYAGSQVERGRYGWDLTQPSSDPTTPFPPQILPQDRASSIYSQFTLDGTRQLTGGYTPALPYRPPTADPNDPRVMGPDGLPYDRHPRYASRTVPGPAGYWGWDSTSSLVAMLVRPGRPTNHPLFFNPYWGPFGTNRLFGPWVMEALLRHGDTGTDALNSDLRRLLPVNLNDPLTRSRITTISNDPNRIGGAPWYRPLKAGETPPSGLPLASNDYDYQMAPAMGGMPPSPPFPYGYGIPMPPDGLPPPFNLPAPPPPPTTGDYVSNQWKSQLGEFLKLDLNRPLPPYPVPRQDPSSPARLIIDIDNSGVRYAFEMARLARQEFAREIWLRLIFATGAIDPRNAALLAVATPEKINALRYLAQLAVNIVDYVDNDQHSYPTPFNWGNEFELFTIGLSSQWVYGTKQPRVVLNEVYIEAAGTGPNFRVYVELFNPMKDPNSREYLANPAGSLPAAAPGIYGVYQIRVLKRQPNQHLRQPDNAAGDPAIDPTPDQANPADFTDLPGTLGLNPGDNQNFFIDPAHDRYRGPDGSSDVNLGAPNAANRGFYVAGPPVPLAPPAGAGEPHVPVPSYQTGNLVCTRSGGGSLTAEPPTIMLRRLLVPYLPPNPATVGGAVNPNLPYNPYITVDYVEEVPVNPDTTPVTARRSFGKIQPLASHLHAWRSQSPHDTPGPISPPVGMGAGFTPPNTPVAIAPLPNQPQTTFFRHNSLEEVPVTLPLSGAGNGLPTGANPLPETRFLNQTLDLPFTWLPQLQRHLMNPSELLGVSGFKPHELMQEFLAPMTFSSAPITPGAGVSVTVTGAITVPPPPAGTIVGISRGHAWSIQTGDVITVGQGVDAERVVVTVTGPDTFTADFTRPHNPPVLIGFIKNGHTPPWFNTSARLHRFLEMVETRHRMAGLSAVSFGAALSPVPGGAVLPAPPYPPLTLATPILTQVTPLSGSDPFGFASGGAFYGIQAGSTVVLDPGGPAEEAVRVVALVPPSPVLPNGAFQCWVQRQHPASVTVMVPAQGGIHPGKVNINLVQDLETFTALADPQLVNAFNPTLGLINPVGAPTPGGITLVSPTSLRWQNVWPPPPTVSGTPLGLQVGSILFFNDPFHMRRRVQVTAMAQDNTTVPPSTLITFTPALPGMVPPNGPAPQTPVSVDNLPALFNALRTSREPVVSALTPFINVQDGRPGTNPLRSLATGFVNNPGLHPSVPSQHPFGQGLNSTVLRDRPGDALQRSLLEIGRPGETIDFRRHELLMKLTNNLTTRSNTFAVWCTVGYFEVMPTYPDVTSNPVVFPPRAPCPEGWQDPGAPFGHAVYRLGAELGRMDGRHKRHRLVMQALTHAAPPTSCNGFCLSTWSRAMWLPWGRSAISPVWFPVPGSSSTIARIRNGCRWSSCPGPRRAMRCRCARTTTPARASAPYCRLRWCTRASSTSGRFQPACPAALTPSAPPFLCAGCRRPRGPYHIH